MEPALKPRIIFHTRRRSIKLSALIFRPWLEVHAGVATGARKRRDD